MKSKKGIELRCNFYLIVYRCAGWYLLDQGLRVIGCISARRGRRHGVMWFRGEDRKKGVGFPLLDAPAAGSHGRGEGRGEGWGEGVEWMSGHVLLSVGETVTGETVCDGGGTAGRRGGGGRRSGQHLWPLLSPDTWPLCRWSPVVRPTPAPPPASPASPRSSARARTRPRVEPIASPTSDRLVG